MLKIFVHYQADNDGIGYYSVCGDDFTDDEADLACASVFFARGAKSWRSSTEPIEHDFENDQYSGSVEVLSCDSTILLDCLMAITSDCKSHVVLLCQG